MRIKWFFSVLIALALAGKAAGEPVVRPKAPDIAVNGAAKLLQIEFIYTVQDHGWFSNAASERLDSTKTVLFEYKSGPGALPAQSAAKSAVLTDAAVKCGELAQLEYPAQIKDLAPGAMPSLQSEISNPEFSVFDDGAMMGRFKCQIHVESKLDNR